MAKRKICAICKKRRVMVWDSHESVVHDAGSSGYRVADFGLDFDLYIITTHSPMLGGDKICMPCFESVLLKSKWNAQQRLLDRVTKRLKRDAS